MMNQLQKEEPIVRRAVFLGSKTLGLRVFQALIPASLGISWSIVHPNDSHDTRSAMHEWKKAARTLDVDLLISSSATQTSEIIRDMRPDIAFVCGWYQLLDEETLSRVPRGFWGVHNSLLPKYRGGSPLTWSILNGDDVVGCTVFELADGMDSGRVLLQVKVSNHVDDSIGSLLTKIEDSLIRKLPGKWLEVLNGNCVTREQNNDEATYCGQRLESDGEIDWNMDGKRIHDFVRAQSPPYPGAFTYLRGQKLAIFKTSPHPLPYFGTPGQVLSRNSESGGVLIAAGSATAINVLEVSSEGETQRAVDLLTSNRIRLGDRLSTV